MSGLGLKAKLFSAPERFDFTRLIARSGAGACPVVDQTVKAIHPLFAAKRHKVDFFFVAWLKTNGRRRRNVEAHAKCRGAVKFQSAVNFKEVKVRAYLDG